MNEEKEPIVSIWCTTFNQKKYIRECLNGFILQQTKNPPLNALPTQVNNQNVFPQHSKKFFFSFFETHFDYTFFKSVCFDTTFSKS